MSKIPILDDTGLDVYAVIQSEAGTYWNGAALEAFDAGSWIDYAVACAEDSGSGRYQCAIPPLAAGIYHVTPYRQVGVDPAISDTPGGPFQVDWDGSALLSGNIFAHVVETGVTFNQLCRAIGAMLCGRVTGGNTTTEIFKAMDNAGTTRVTVTADEDGNRSAVALNL